jgi:hypothetical protein
MGYGVVVEGPVRRGRRLWRWPPGLLVVLLRLAPVSFVGGGWYFSEKVRSDASRVDEPSEPDYLHEVVAAGEGSTTFALGEDPPDDLLPSETLGAGWDGGYGSAVTQIA